MRVYGLQIHDTGSEFHDKLDLYENFQDCVNDYFKHLEHYKKICVCMRAKEEPTLDESDNEAHGMFMFENADGSFTKAIVFDYDIM